MAAIAQPSATAALPLPRVIHRNGLHTVVVTAAATFAGAMVVSALMALSILLAGPLTNDDAAPSSQPLPQPSAVQAPDL